METTNKPTIAFTAGDPAGIGPELLLQALPELRKSCEPLLVGNAIIFERVAETLGLDMPEASLIHDPTDIDGRLVTPGTVSADGGKAAYDCLQWAIKGALAKEIDAIVTAPLNKESLHLAGIQEPGHTEILAKACDVQEFAMLYWSHELAVSMVTIHCALSQVPERLSGPAIKATVRMTAETMARIKGKAACIGVLGLNPHAGEHGLFGHEEEDIIKPAIEDLRNEGLLIEGPIPADTAFTEAAMAHYDGFVAMYHDQASIPFKMLHFNDGVNHTMGLPIIRTSVDHGTAFNIAWQGKAEIGSLLAATEMAGLLSS